LALGALLLPPLVLSPKLGIAVVAAALIVWSASRSIAWPLGLAGFAAPVIALVGHDPFPRKGAPLILFAWLGVAIVFELGRGKAGTTLRKALSSPLFVSSGVLLALLLARLPASSDPAYANFKVELFVLGGLTLLVAGVLLGRRTEDLELFLVLSLVIDALSGLLVLRQLGTPALAVAWFTVSLAVPSAATLRSLSTFSGSKSGVSASGRDQLWTAAWHTFPAHPAFGIGTGSFATADRVEVCPGPGCLDRYPHNV